uniref:Uncharacterized protein n=1 Tax=Timema poppense TaxID=170557 RepID=A0A7R9HE59_TIMPO|nr:unnamed protein product [Timema poppensis]
MNNLSIVATLCAILASLVAADDMEEMSRMLHNSCRDEIGIEEDVITACRKGEFPDDPKLKNYMKCVLTQAAVMNDAGDIDFDMMMSMLPDNLKEAASRVAVACKELVGADAAEKAYSFNKCFYKSEPSVS